MVNRVLTSLERKENDLKTDVNHRPLRSESQQPPAPAATTASAALPARARRSRGNAVRHGLTAVTLVEELVEKLLGEAAYEPLATALRQQFRAEGPLEEMRVGRITQHVAALELGRHAQPAALREGCRQAGVLGHMPTHTVSGDVPGAAGAQARVIKAGWRRMKNEE